MTRLPGWRDVVASAARSGAFSRLVRGLESVDPMRDDLLSVLTYHRIGERNGNGSFYPSLVSATPAELAEQLTFLRGRFHLVGLADVVERRLSGRALPPRSLLVTFDDAYPDIAEHVTPLASRLGVPVAVFVPTAFPDSDRAFWWDRLYAAIHAGRGSISTPFGTLQLESSDERVAAFAALHRRIRALPDDEAMDRVGETVEALGAPPMPPATLGWSDLQSVRADGVTLAAHSRTHPLLDRIGPERLADEVGGSLGDLEQRLGPTLPAFAYPGGAYDETVVGALASAGVIAAFTTRRGINDLRRVDWLRLRRINVGPRATLPLLRAQLLARAALVMTR